MNARKGPITHCVCKQKLNHLAELASLTSFANFLSVHL